MAFSLYIEDQVHKREYTGTVHSGHLEPVVEKAHDDELLAGVDEHGDTMFNVPQMRRIKSELERIRQAHPETGISVEVLEILINKAILDRGYLWISGD